jgi:hexosaminidase
MLLPRMLALAETAWSAEDNKNYKNFAMQRIPRHLAMLDKRGYNYRVPVALGADDTVLKGDKFRIELRPSVEGAKIHYTIDGRDPSENDLEYTAPLDFDVPEKWAILFKSIVITSSGKRSIVTTVKMQR